MMRHVGQDTTLARYLRTQHMIQFPHASPLPLVPSRDDVQPAAKAQFDALVPVLEKHLSRLHALEPSGRRAYEIVYNAVFRPASPVDQIRPSTRKRKREASTTRTSTDSHRSMPHTRPLHSADWMEELLKGYTFGTVKPHSTLSRQTTATATTTTAAARSRRDEDPQSATSTAPRSTAVSPKPREKRSHTSIDCNNTASLSQPDFTRLEYLTAACEVARGDEKTSDT